MPRVGKVKVFTEEGKLIRHGTPRENDFGIHKIMGIFTASEIVRSGVIIAGILFTAGMLWANNQAHFHTVDNDVEKFTKLFGDFKNDEQSFHRTIFSRLDDKDKRIDCLAENQRGCCASAQNC